METWREKRGLKRVVRFRGRCSCGASSGVLTTAGMVHGWFSRHLNRYPELTASLVQEAALAKAAAEAGKRSWMNYRLNRARAVSDELRRRTWEYRTEVEQQALDLYEVALVAVSEAATTTADATTLPQDGPEGGESYRTVGDS